MRSICLSFQVHQPFRLRTYRFFNIGEDHQYYDEYQNRYIARRVAEKCYIPANKMLLDLIKEYGDAFKVSFSISGTALDQFAQYTPEVLKSFRQLAETGSVEFIAAPYAHSLSALNNQDEFIRQVDLHRKAIRGYFGQDPVTFRNTEMIYSDRIGEIVAEMGFSAMLTEGAKHILGWKSPNYLYCNAINPKLKVLLRNFRLSDDIAFRFSTQAWSEWPLTTEKFTGWLNKIDPAEEVVNIFLDYEAIGERQWKESGIFDFFKSLPHAVFKHTNFTFANPSEVAKNLQPVSAIHVTHPISWADEERDLTSWLGNELQDEAFSKLYSIAGQVTQTGDPDIIKDWQYLQTADHLYYMCTKWFSDGAVHKYFNPYPSPYEAFINYMNVLSDFLIRVENAVNVPAGTVQKEKAEPVKKTTKKAAAPKKVVKKTAPVKETKPPAAKKPAAARATKPVKETKTTTPKKAAKPTPAKVVKETKSAAKTKTAAKTVRKTTRTAKKS
jgi:alpha-amylase